ncbi:hypothetical protein TP70_06210 [Staphylococcus microti]|uniref:DUF1659 domain-containing protein n=1 Tax=Staphylococcus microti TaxID=569857 RepID=A0A0D6XR37_9STAP|nr:hypothetical protein [Staphylococcus microti]KIX90711.1 hypothetical protein TP70_06210 [Staphylococcus microti]PNZ81726.1 DUF1659 domain-containing protein [Staphylococcus microti]SUM56708.1 Uncharacterised protein [Staphylococcus microti]
MTIKNVAIILTQSTTTQDGKTVKTSRKINNLNPDASTEDFRTFAAMIEVLTGEHYDQIEVVKTSMINV